MVPAALPQRRFGFTSARSDGCNSPAGGGNTPVTAVSECRLGAEASVIEKVKSMLTPEQAYQALGQDGAAALFGGGGEPEERALRLRSLLFNGAVRPDAAAVVACRDVEAVQAAVRLAAEHRMPVAVVGGGHDISGRGLVKDNLVLDLRSMKQIEYDEGFQHVTIGTGVLASELLQSLPADRAVIVGGCLSVGIVGFTLGGGYGPLTAGFGLSCDALVEASIVLADGSFVLASEGVNPDLFWAVRGGGGGFGVVTSIKLATHSLPDVLSSAIVVPLEHAKDALIAVQEAIDQEPVHLSIFSAFVVGPEGRPVLFASALWTGPRSSGIELLDALVRATGGVEVKRQSQPFKETFDPQAEAAWPKGDNYHLITRNVSRLTDRVIDILVEGARELPTPKDFLLVHDFHGAATRVAADATAFPLRDDHFMIEITGHWAAAEPDGGDDSRRWAEDLSRRLLPVELPGGYPALLAPHEADRVREFYGSSAERLSALKLRVDPQDMFRSAAGRIEMT